VDFHAPSTLVRLAYALSLSIGLLVAPLEARAQQLGANTDTLPAAPADSAGADGLLSDLERIVQSTESSGWFADRVAFAEIEGPLLESVCRSSEAARSRARSILERRGKLLGNPEAIFAQNGRQETRQFQHALTNARQLGALTRALDSLGDCPFWIDQEVGFLGRQTDRQRFTLNVETGGNLQLRNSAGRWTFGGGGLGRILPGIGLGDQWTLLSGIEFGGGAMLRPGGTQTEFLINYFPALPIVLRYRDLDWHYDVESGPVGIFNADNTRLSLGARLGGAVGVYALRTRNVIPWAGIALGYEYYLENSTRPAAHFIRGGLRVGIVWDP